MIDSKTISVTAILVNLMGTTVAFAMEDKDQSFTASKTVRQLPPHVSPQTPDEFDPSTLNLVKLAVTLEKEKEDPKIESSLAGIKPPELNGGDFVAVNRPNGVVFNLRKTQQYGKYFIEWKSSEEFKWKDEWMNFAPLGTEIKSVKFRESRHTNCYYELEAKTGMAPINPLLFAVIIDKITPPVGPELDRGEVGKLLQESHEKNEHVSLKIGDMNWRGYYPSSLPKPTPVKSVLLQRTRGLAGPLANCYNIVFEDGSEQLVGFHSVEAFTFSELEKLMQ